MNNFKYSYILFITLILIFPLANGNINLNKNNQDIISILNEKPIAYFTWNPIWPNISTIIHFDASLSYDPDGSISVYSWDFDNDSIPDKTGINVTWNWNDEGEYPVRLSVCDDLLLCNGTTKMIRVLDSTPVADFKWDPENPIINQIVTLDASDSFDPDNSIMTYYWDYDGDPYWDAVGGEEDKIVEYSWDSIGTYIITLKVEDINFNYDIIEKSIIITDNNPPINPYNPYPRDGAVNISIDVIISWEGGDPNTGDLVSYDVYFGSIPPLQKVSSNQSETDFNPDSLLNDLTYFWNVVAWDNHGLKTIGPSWHFTTASEKDNISPYVKIISPTSGLYFYNQKIRDLSNNIIVIGQIDIIAEAKDYESGIEYVEYELIRYTNSISGIFEGEPYIYRFNKISFGTWHVTITAYDNAGNKANDQIQILKIL